MWAELEGGELASSRLVEAHKNCKKLFTKLKLTPPKSNSHTVRDLPLRFKLN